jgi:hypothetical protein
VPLLTLRKEEPPGVPLLTLRKEEPPGVTLLTLRKKEPPGVSLLTLRKKEPPGVSLLSKYSGDQITEDAMGGTCGTHEGKKKCIQDFGGEIEGKGYLEDLHVHVRIILK